MRAGFLPVLFLLVALFAPLGAAPLQAAPAPSQGRLLGISFGEAVSAASVSVPMQIALLMTLLSLLPAVVMSVTPFLRITIVLHFLRQAMGTQSTPSNQVLVGLSLFVTMLIVAPVAGEIRAKAWTPLEKGAITESQALEEAARPVKIFLARYAREKDVRLFVELAHAPSPRSAADLDLGILVPAYILSELKTGFQIGAVLFLPFLVIDVVVASVTLAIGMVQLPPVMISAPFKILLFVLVDGWNLTVGSLIKSFY